MKARTEQRGTDLTGGGHWPAGVGVLDRLRRWWVGRAAVSRRTAVGFGAVLALAIGLGVAGSAMFELAAAAWLVAGSAAWLAATALELDVRRRIGAHDASGLPALRGGWRLAAPLAVVPPGDLLILDALDYLYDAAQVVWSPGNGATRPGGRWRYEVGLRAVLRRYAQSRGLPVRRGDRLGRELLGLGLLRAVPINNAVAWQLVHDTAADAIRAYERTVGRRTIAWELGRDPRATVEPRLPAAAARIDTGGRTGTLAT